MKVIFVFTMAALFACFWIGCRQDKINPAAPSMTERMANAPATSPSSATIQPAEAQGPDHHVTADLIPVENSGVTGHVTVDALPHGGVNITVVGSGLNPGEEYLSLYYENHTCEIEPYEEDDVIGTYIANASGTGQTQNKLEDDLDEVNSISIRRASDFTLLACADIHP